MSPRPFDLVLFDLDNTLYNNDEAYEAAALAQLSQTLSPSQLRAIAAGEMLPPEALSADAAELLTRLRMEWLEPMHLRPDASALLDALDAAALPYGIVTNAPPVQKVKISRLGLDKRTVCVLISDLEGIHKPDPAIFVRAANRAGVAVDRTMFVGDSLENDVTGARAAGMKSAWLKPVAASVPDAGQAPDWTVTSLVDLLPVLGL